MKIVVIAGGLSPERDVSLSSGALIANALIENGHETFLLDLYKGLDGTHENVRFLHGGLPDRFSYTVPEQEPDLAMLRTGSPNGDALIGPYVVELCRYADLVFIALHGDIGENGKLQALFDIYGIKYTGTGYQGSMLAMDKDLAKELMVQNGVRTPEWVLLDLTKPDCAGEAARIGLPCAVKPCGCGSSVGVSLVYDAEQLHEALSLAARYEPRIIVERLIEGREFSGGVLEGKVLPIIEIIPHVGFYDYATKYQKGLADDVCPAHLDTALTEHLQETTLRVHNILKLGSYSRIDFLVDREGVAYCLEANSLPGMTPTSLLPQEAAATGIGYNELCERIVRAAMK